MIERVCLAISLAAMGVWVALAFAMEPAPHNTWTDANEIKVWMAIYPVEVYTGLTSGMKVYRGLDSSAKAKADPFRFIEPFIRREVDKRIEAERAEYERLQETIKIIRQNVPKFPMPAAPNVKR